MDGLESFSNEPILDINDENSSESHLEASHDVEGARDGARDDDSPAFYDSGSETAELLRTAFGKDDVGHSLNRAVEGGHVQQTGPHESISYSGGVHGHAVTDHQHYMNGMHHQNQQLMNYLGGKTYQHLSQAAVQNAMNPMPSFPLSMHQQARQYHTMNAPSNGDMNGATSLSGLESLSNGVPSRNNGTHTGQHVNSQVIYPVGNAAVRPQPPPNVPLHPKAHAQTAMVTPNSASLGDSSVIELSDDESEGDGSTKRRRRLDQSDNPSQRAVPSQVSSSNVSNTARYGNMPSWMKSLAGQRQMPRFERTPPIPTPVSRLNGSRSFVPPTILNTRQGDPVFFDIPSGFTPTWDNPIPAQALRKPAKRRHFELSLINVQEFTITGLPVDFNSQPSSLAGLRMKIKELSKEHGKATFERNKDNDGEGRWRIPLGAYRSFYSYLVGQPLVTVTGIPENQLKIASLGKSRLEKGYPSASKLISFGVPRGLATALAPFQRGGVDFVVEKEGRALIADEMGLGKTVQGIASLSVYHREWPVLVLTPSSARYHWENEFQHWLGKTSPVNTQKQERVKLGGESDDEEEDDAVVDESNCMPLLDDSQIHVLISGKDAVIPHFGTKVVICSYSLAPALVSSGKLYPGLFQAALVDESHMLKNIKSKRTKNLIPVLHATKRCVLLSGTPALAKPTELWPQLKILSTERTGWWDNEEDFLEKYAKTSSTVRRAELHAMLTGTVMIRRLKNTILKSLPKKIRSKAVVDVSSPAMRKEFHNCMVVLREGRGQLGKLARQHSAFEKIENGPMNGNDANMQEAARASIQAEADRRYREGLRAIDYSLSTYTTRLSNSEIEDWKARQVADLRREVQVWRDERVREFEELEAPTESDGTVTRKSVLNRMYSLSGEAKLPLIAGLIKKWLADPAKGKLCVFAHHIFMLDEIVKRAGLSNDTGSQSGYMRIDGSTSPRDRQAQIKKFQTDPAVRVAVLGITAAGVAVTLTAASTVWFAELFWTPALMIQAEDRCHRIGQNSRVNCLYLVATGTLDELLWKLLEKKFQDLGEFVEGQEKQKIVVHRTYSGTKELNSMFDNEAAEDSEDIVSEGGSDDDDGQKLLELEDDLQGDIALLGREELTMMKTEEDDEGIDDKFLESAVQPEQGAGSTIEEPIALSDDDDDVPSPDAKPDAAVSGDKVKDPESSEKQKEAQNTNGRKRQAEQEPTGTLDLGKPLENTRGYTITFEGTSFGIQMFMYHGRPVVGRRVDLKYDWPGAGDVLVAVNGNRLPMIDDMNQIIHYMRTCLSQGKCDVLFVEVPALKKEIARINERDRKREEKRRAASAKMASAGVGDVIDLLDDD